ncbi:MAG: ATP-dependent Clp protease ATP-binding subunit ClpX, partial [Candidatus Marinamargulisbacteria bacterium]
MTETPDKPLTCSFCGKPQQMVNKLVVGPEICICDECVAVCNNIIREEKDADITLPEKVTANIDELPKPVEITAKLNDHIIGQDRAKKILSVAV